MGEDYIEILGYINLIRSDEGKRSEKNYANSHGLGIAGVYLLL